MDRPSLTRGILSWLCVLAVLGGGFVDARKTGAAVDGLGRAVYLPSVNSLDDRPSGPLIFDARDLGDLAKTEDIEHTEENSRWFSSSERLKNEIAREFGIEAPDRELSFSVESEFRRLVGSEREVNAAEVYAVRLHRKTYIPRDSSLHDFPLKKNFMNDFHELPTIVKDAHDNNAWQPFREFINMWGSHIVESAYTGSVYQSWSSARASNNYKQAQLEARACMQAEGLRGNALEACSRYNQKDREDAMKLTAFDTKRVRGGTTETRRSLEKDLVTKNLIEKFLREDDVDEQPVRYEFMPLWNLMLERSDRGSDDEKRALALQAYYQGWMATRCPLVMTTGQVNNRAQMMVPEYTKDKKPTGQYLCIRRCEGCHSRNDDCHFEATQACCRAYGPSALRRVVGDYVVRASDYNSGWCDANNGCQYSVGSGCYCDKSNEEERCNYEFPLNPNDPSLKYKIIWNQQDSHRARRFGNILAMEK